MTNISKKIAFNKKLAKNIQRKWSHAKAKSEAKRRRIENKYTRRVQKLAATNAANKAKFAAAVAVGQAKFAAMAKNNAMKAALATARIKLQTHVNNINERSTKRHAAKMHNKEADAKASLKRKELGAKRAA